MPARTYVPTARLFVNQTYSYLTRWQDKMSAHLTAPQITALIALIACIAEFLEAMGPEVIGD